MFIRNGIGCHLRATSLQKCAAFPMRARTQGSQTFVSLNPRLESNKEQEEEVSFHPGTCVIQQFFGNENYHIDGLPLVRSFYMAISIAQKSD